jgi:hypothetical protein
VKEEAALGLGNIADVLTAAEHAGSSVTPVRPIASVVIPAHNEESVIVRCLAALTDGAIEGELEIVVVCNGCSDGTAAAARAMGKGVLVVETDEANKVAALNLGDRSVHAFPRVYLDADIELSIGAVRALAARLETSDALAATTGLDVDFAGVASVVQRHYRARSRAMFPPPLVGRGAYALSEAGRARFGHFPPVIGDDLFVESLFRPEECSTVEAYSVTVHPPRTFRDLVQAESRKVAGNIEHKRRFGDDGRGTRSRALVAAHRSPSTWGDLAVFIFLTGFLRGKARLYLRSGHGTTWEPVR